MLWLLGITSYSDTVLLLVGGLSYAFFVPERERALSINGFKSMISFNLSVSPK